MRISRLDGIRGLAILLVMGVHLFRFPTDIPLGRILERISQAGWVGVPLFFVLSGFLITGILVESRSAENYWSSFYVRRALRIFPLYFGFLAVYQLLVVEFQLVRFDPARTAQAAEEIPWVWAYATNILIAKKGMFITASLNHFWTLAIEEHFYLVWPAVIFFTQREGLKRFCWLGILVAIAFRFAFRLSSPEGMAAATVLTPCRMDSLFVGALFCLAYRDYATTEKFRRACVLIFGASGLFLLSRIAVTGGLYSWDPVMVALGFTVVPAFFGAGMMLVLLSSPSAWIARAFESRALRFFGKYSYAIYVLHHPINIAAERFWPTAVWAERSGHWLGATLLHSLAVGALSVGLSWLSWHLYEKRFLHWKDRFTVRYATSKTETAVQEIPSRA